MFLSSECHEFWIPWVQIHLASDASGLYLWDPIHQVGSHRYRPWNKALRVTSLFGRWSEGQWENRKAWQERVHYAVFCLWEHLGSLPPRNSQRQGRLCLEVIPSQGRGSWYLPLSSSNSKLKGALMALLGYAVLRPRENLRQRVIDTA